MIQKKILIIDDDQDLLRGMNIRLRASGYRTVCATDGIAAIKVAQEEKPDLIILDVGLPAGDGFTVMERLPLLPRAAFIPIIVVSARDPLVNKKRALQAGALTYLQKPVDNSLLLAVIEKTLNPTVPEKTGVPK